MKIKLTSVMVDNQEKALKFYTHVLGFREQRNIPVNGAKWLTVVSPDEPDCIELLLEPIGNPAASAFQRSLFDQGIPLTSFLVDDIRSEYARLRKQGVAFQGEPQTVGETTMAVFDDTCGNLIQIYQVYTRYPGQNIESGPSPLQPQRSRSWGR